MEIQKRKILLESSIDRTTNSPTWGMLTATTFHLSILLTQSMDDMGIFTDIEYLPASTTSNIPNYDILKNKLLGLGITFPFMGAATQPIMNTFNNVELKTLRPPNKIVSDYYNYLNLKISGYTDTKLEDVKSYNLIDPYRIGFDVDKSNYYNYANTLVNGVSRIKSMGEPKIYVFNTTNDVNLGTVNQVNGLQYLEYTGKSRTVVIEEIATNIQITQFNYVGEGWNNTNTSLSAIVKEEYLFGIVFPPEIQSDVFIERGITPVTDKHLRLSEISNIGELQNYGNGYYKLNKQ